MIGAVAVVGGVLFGVVQLRQFRRQRQDAGAQIFIQQWGGEQMRELDVVYRLPRRRPAELLEQDPATCRAANSIYLDFEQLGILVHQRTIALATANEWAGGAVRVCWRKLRPWIEWTRETARSQRPGEWFQWLAEALAELPDRDEATGAHVVAPRLAPREALAPQRLRVERRQSVRPARILPFCGRSGGPGAHDAVEAATQSSLKAASTSRERAREALDEERAAGVVA